MTKNDDYFYSTPPAFVQWPDHPMCQCALLPVGEPSTNKEIVTKPYDMTAFFEGVEGYLKMRH